MGANKYENFECVVIKRSEIHTADYNPRRITESALKKLKKWFKTQGKGQLAPITVNKNTMTVVSGHQRLTVLDQLNKYPDKDYELTVAMTELDEKTEIEANVFMNNKSAMGDFDYDMLGQLHDMFPEISFTEDFGFDESEVSLMFDDSFLKENEEVSISVGESEEAEQVKKDYSAFKEYMNDRAKTVRDSVKGSHENEKGNIYLEHDDFTFTVVCMNNDEKHKIMKILHERENEKFIKSAKLYDIYDHKVKLREYSKNG